MSQRAENLADLQWLDSLDTRGAQVKAAPYRQLNDLPGREQDGPMRGIMFGMALSTAVWVLIGLTVLAWNL